jgi:hypothetical protein
MIYILSQVDRTPVDGAADLRVRAAALPLVLDYSPAWAAGLTAWAAGLSAQVCAIQYNTMQYNII